MENVINIGTFIQQLTYFIKVGIYINKGIENNALLERCVKLYNKYKTIESQATINGDNEVFVRKCLKRLNLVLKTDTHKNGDSVDLLPVDIRVKENQLKILSFQPHQSIVDNNMNDMINYATKFNIDILTEVPLMFFLRESKYRELLWEYARSLFYISQLLISKVDANADPTDNVIILKKQIFDDAALHLEEILVSIADIEERIKLEKILSLDKYLNIKLVKTGINDKNVNEARQEVKDIFQKKGIGNDNSMGKMIDSISDKLTNIDLSKGNIIQSMFGIAQNVANEMRGDLEDNPEKFQKTIGAITEVFQEAMQNENSGQVPPELKNAFNSILATTKPGEQPSEQSEAELNKALESIIQSNNLDKNEFFGNIRGQNGEIDVSRLENYLGKLN